MYWPKVAQATEKVITYSDKLSKQNKIPEVFCFIVTFYFWFCVHLTLSGLERRRSDHRYAASIAEDPAKTPDRDSPNSSLCRGPEATYQLKRD